MQSFPVARDENELDAVKRQLVARLHHTPFITRHREIGLPDSLPSRGSLLHAFAVVDEAANLHARGKSRQPSDMVTVKVRGQVVVDMIEPRLVFHDVLDAVYIAVVKARITGVHQHRLPRISHHQRRRSSLDIDPIDIESGLRTQRDQGQQQGGENLHLPVSIGRMVLEKLLAQLSGAVTPESSA